MFHFSSCFLFCLVCVPFGSGSRFCLERNIFVCVCGPGPLVSGSRFSFGKNCIRSKTVRLWDPGFCLKPSISVYVRDRLAWGPFLCLGRSFVGSPPGVGFLFFGTKYYCVCGLRLFGSGSRFWSYRIRDHLALKEKQGVDVVTAALTSVRNALQKPETVFDLRRLLLTSRPWFEHQGHLPTKRRTITQPFWMN